MAQLKDLPTGQQKVQMVRAMFDSIAPRYDLVNRVMTFGLDRRWRRRTVESLQLPAGSIVIDVACGTGDLCTELRKRRYRAMGLDLSAGMLSEATTRAPLIQADALALPFKNGSVDGVTCGFALRNVENLDALFSEMSRVVRPGGRIALLEVATPENPVLRFGHSVYFRKIVPFVGGVLSDRKAYSYLPRSTSYLPSTDELVSKIGRSGFDKVQRTLVGGGAAQVITGTRK